MGTPGTDRDLGDWWGSQGLTETPGTNGFLGDRRGPQGLTGTLETDGGPRD